VRNARVSPCPEETHARGVDAERESCLGGDASDGMYENVLLPNEEEKRRTFGILEPKWLRVGCPPARAKVLLLSFL